MQSSDPFKRATFQNMVGSLLNDIEFGENWNLTPRMNFLMQGFFWPVEWTELRFLASIESKLYLCQDTRSSSNRGFWQGGLHTTSCLTIGLAQKYSYLPTPFSTEMFGRNKRWEVQTSLPIPSGTWKTDLNLRQVYLEPKLGTEEISLAGRNFNFHRHTSWDFTQIRAYLPHLRIAAFSCNPFWQASPDGTEVRGTEQPPH